MSLALSDRERELLAILEGKDDVLIPVIYFKMGGPNGKTVVYQQRWLGGYISRLNKALEGSSLRVEPGALKRSYRLATT